MLIFGSTTWLHTASVPAAALPRNHGASSLYQHPTSRPVSRHPRRSSLQTSSGQLPRIQARACHPLIPPAKKTEFIDWYFESRISQCRDGGGLVAGVFEGDKLVAVGLCKPNGENFGLAKLLKEWEEKWGQAHLEFAIRIVQEADEHVERLIVASDFHLFMLSTLESMRGRGIGSEMLRSLLSWAKADAQKKDKPGSIKIDLDCPTEPLVRMYEKFNFVLRGDGIFLGDPGVKLFFMDKEIDL